MKVRHKITFLALALAFVAPALFGHGELELQIAAKTKQIETATNGLSQLYLERGNLHREHKDWALANADYDQAEKLGADRFDVDLQRALVLFDAEQFESARTLLDKLIATKPQRGDARVARARTLVKLDLHQLAVTDFWQALELLHAPLPQYYIEPANALITLNRPDDALRTLDAGIRKFGPLISLHRLAVDIEAGRKNYDGALKRIDAILAFAQRKETWLARRGEILVADGRLTEARAAYESALTAITALPAPIQNAPPMQNLRTQINEALIQIANGPKQDRKQVVPAKPVGEAPKVAPLVEPQPVF